MRARRGGGGGGGGGGLWVVFLSATRVDTASPRRCHAAAGDSEAGTWAWGPPSDTGSLEYRGPFANAFTAWTGYQCSHAFCPTGDNPYTWGVNEVQALNCSLATDGAFNVTFRGAADAVRVPATASAADFEARLESLPTIRDVVAPGAL